MAFAHGYLRCCPQILKSVGAVYFANPVMYSVVSGAPVALDWLIVLDEVIFESGFTVSGTH